MSEHTKMQMRLAIRSEGKFVNAYLAERGTMDRAILLGSILRAIVERDEAIWDQWKTMMTAGLGNAIEDALGVRPDQMVEEQAPEHERSGRS